MQWIQYVVLALFLLFLVSRFLPVKGLRHLMPAEVEEMLKKQRDHQFVDVRETGEYRGGHIKGFVNIPLSQLKGRLNELDPARTVVLTCQSGMRSRQAAKLLSKNGFSAVCHLRTGVCGWSGKLVR